MIFPEPSAARGLGAWRRGGALLLAALLATVARGADPASDIDAQYQAAVAVLNKPPLAGILVTEVEPESAALAAGLRGGDIITEYYGTRVTTLRGLREQVAEAVARRLEDVATNEHVLVRVRRGQSDKILEIAREPLGIRAVEVQANVPGPRNPPPDLRGTLELDWAHVLQAISDDRASGGGAGEAYRTLERLIPEATGTMPASPEENWIGWQVCTLEPDGAAALRCAVDVYRIDPSAPAPEQAGQAPVAERSTVRFHLVLGDFRQTPAFVLDELSAVYPAQARTVVSATAKRRGESLQASITVSAGTPGRAGGAPAHDVAAPLNAVPQAALPWISAALPQKADATLGLCLLSVRDLVPRPGYVLTTRGREPLPPEDVAAPRPATEPAGFRVDLMHCGVVVESYWFSEQRRLLCVQTPSGTGYLLSRRVADLHAADLPMDRKAVPATTQSSNP